MAKPIFIVESPITQTEEEFGKMVKSLDEKFNDYHVLVVQKNIDDFNFNVFYDKDFTEVNYEELKEFIKNLKKEN